MPQAIAPTASTEYERFQPNPQIGLTHAQAEQRRQQGLHNDSGAAPTKTVGRIVTEHICTLFNLINAVLAVAVLAVGSYKNMLFMGVVLCNLAIGIIQEMRAKRTIDKLSLIASAHATVVREGQTLSLPMEEVVLDDILLLQSGQQIATDAILLTGECDVNESLITGESDAVHKAPSDKLLAGSFVVSGHGQALADRVGKDTYVSMLSRDAKKWKRAKSEIMGSLKSVIKVISILIIPIGAVLFYNQMTLADNTIQQAVVQTVAALIGMIPEGLMLLTSTVLAVGVVRLSRHQVLVQDLYCIEMLARVDTLCLDKTGTLTEGCMEVIDTIPLAGGDTADRDAVEHILCELVAALQDNNATFAALAERYTAQPRWRPLNTVPFSSQTKWSGVQFEEHGSYVLGAAEFVFPDMPEELRKQLTAYARENRVLLLAHSKELVADKQLPSELRPVALVLLRDKIRKEACQTLRFFAEQGVDIKVISGDSVDTVAGIAKVTGIAGWDRAVDMSRIQTEEELREAAANCCVFGRVTPVQKKQLILALKEQGHTVAMTGDGVNDVLALREADCSIAMASGTDAARTVSQLVLLNSNFDSMPQVVAEGRRSINNIQRSASLFLVKTIYATLTAILFLFIKEPYPFIPIQFTLISAVTIGIPSMVLALEPNRDRIQGRFLRNVLLRALPGALTIVGNLLMILTYAQLSGLPSSQCNTLCVILTGFSGLLLLFHVCQPWNVIRRLLFAAMCAAFAIGVLFFRGLFSLSPLSPLSVLMMVLFMMVALGVFDALQTLIGYIYRHRDR